MHEKRRPPKTAPTTEPNLRRIPPMNIIADESNLLAAVRELYSRLPETRYLEAWEFQHVLYSLNYTDDLAEEAEIAAAINVARTDWMPDEGAA
jgi:hypothetical protein